MGKKKKGPVVKKGLDEWMATYSDMVTLLLCFFVLLYSSSTQDEVRFQYIFQAFSTGGKYINTIVGQEPETPREGDGKENSDIPPVIEGNGTGSDSPTGSGTDPDSFSDLYSALQAAVDANELAESVSVEGNSGQIRIRFNSDVLFDPDSAVLKDSGRKVLSLMTPSIRACNNFISLVTIQGHTAPISGVSAVNDWDLSCMRASVVTKYMEFTKTVLTEKLKAEGLGPNVPIDGSDTEEARAKNRRVEIVIDRSKDLTKDTEVFKAIMEYDYNQHFNNIDANGNVIDDNFLNSDDVVSKIASAIDDKYGGKTSQSVEVYQPPVGPSSNSGVLSVSEDDYVVTEAETAEETTGTEGTENTTEEN